MIGLKTAFGASILAYWKGDLNAKHIIERDDGYKKEAEVRYLFEEPTKWMKEEIEALNHIPPESTILDIGCGVGRVATYLQQKGHKVVGLDSCPEAIEITKARGLKLTYTANICQLDKPPLFNVFDVILMMGNNLGVCGEEKKTEELLIRLNSFLKKEGLLIFSCRDPFLTDNPIHLEYHEKNRQKGRSPGLVRIRLVYKELRDEWWDLLLVDPVTVEKIVKKAGFTKSVLIQPKNSPIYYFVAQK